MNEKTYEEICIEFGTLFYRHKEINKLGVEYIVKNRIIHKMVLEKVMGHRKHGRFNRFFNKVFKMGLLQIIHGKREEYRVDKNIAEYYERYKDDERQNKLSKKWDKIKGWGEKIVWLIAGMLIKKYIF